MMRDFMLLIFTKKIKIPLQQKKDKDIYKVTSINNMTLSYNKEVINHKMKDT